MDKPRLKNLSLLEVESLIHCARLRDQQRVRSSAPTPPPDATPKRDALDRATASLSPEKLRDLVALTWLGRGSGGETAEDWPALLENAEFNTSEDPAAKTHLAVYLDDGLKKLGYTAEERPHLGD